jgi:uncharacterized MAPEG superfamily protein
MTAELWILLWAALLGFLHILLAAMAWTGEVGLKYNAGPRDAPRETSGVLTGRLKRAQANFFETFPLFAAAILVAVVAGETGGHAGWGALVYLGARVVYLPLYALGVPVLRSLVWAVSIIGIAMVWLAAAGVWA